MALFTGKGDEGTAKAFDCKRRLSKGSELFKALGTIDDQNSELVGENTLAYYTL